MSDEVKSESEGGSGEVERASDDETEIKKPTDEEFQDFKMRISEWTKLDEQIHKLQIAIRERKTHQKALSEGIQTFMAEYGYDNINTNKGRIVHSIRKTKEPIKVNDIRALMKESTLTTSELFKLIFEKERNVRQKESIRLVIPPVSMALEI